MTEPGGHERQQIPTPEMNVNFVREGYERSRGRSDRSSYGLASLLMEEAITPEVNGNAYKAVTSWLVDQLGPIALPSINEWGLTPIMESLNFRIEEDPLKRITDYEVKRDLDGLSAKITGEVYNNPDTPEINEIGPDLTRAIAKDRLREYVSRKDVRGDIIEEIIPEGAEMEKEEYRALDRFKRRLNVVLLNCSLCGEFGGVLQELVLTRLNIIKDTVLLDSGLLDLKSDEIPKDTKEKVEKKLDKEHKAEKRVAIKMEVANEELEKSIKDDKTGTKWLNFVKAVGGAVSILVGNGKQAGEAFDLDPILRCWENMSRMIEKMNPSNLIETLKYWPSFGEGFKGLLAICSGKYALGSNGEIYPTGAYGMGYIKDGKVIDIDDAYKPGTTERTKANLIDGVVRLEENQIWLNGRAVNVDAKVNPDIKSGRPFDGWNGKINGIIFDEKPLEIFSKNMLYWGEINDENVNSFMDGVKKYVEGLYKSQGKVMWGPDISFGVHVAKSFFEMSLFGNWFGFPRDSKGNLYYSLYNQETLEKGKSAPKRTPIYGSDGFLVMSSNSESEQVKFGIPVIGWDEGTLFPDKVNDWGKLLGTRVKQLAEDGKGRKTGEKGVLTYLPENLIVPFLSQEQIGAIIESDKPNEVMAKMFKEMKSVQKLKTFWLGIAKGIAVYEFISSNFIGEKEPNAIQKDLITFFMQPRNLEALSKNIDLSLLYADPMEAARLRVNLIATAIASVVKDFYNEEFISPAATGVKNTKVEERLKTIISNEEWKSDSGSNNEFSLALKQLITSRFIGSGEDLEKILAKLLKASNDIKFEEGICFTKKEFETVFGQEYLNRIWLSRKDRLDKTVDRRKRKPTF